MSPDNESQPIKMVIVGDGGVGKTSLLQNYLEGTLPSTYEPTVYENHVGCYSDGENDNHISFCDSAGQDQYSKLRPLSYQDTTVFLVCFNVTHRDSFTHVSSKWLPEIRKFCGLEVPTVLVGTKTDLRVERSSLLKDREKNSTNVTEEEGMALAKSQKMFAYVECSALMSTGCHNAVKQAVAAARNYDMPPNRKTCCTIL